MDDSAIAKHRRFKAIADGYRTREYGLLTLATLPGTRRSITAALEAHLVDEARQAGTWTGDRSSGSPAAPVEGASAAVGPASPTFDDERAAWAAHVARQHAG